MGKWIMMIIIILMFAYAFYIRPKIRENREQLKFDSRVMGFIDSLYITEIIGSSATVSEIRSYAQMKLIQSRKLHKGLLEYTTADGYHETVYVDGRSSHIKFALICIAMYAKENGNQKLVAWCDYKIIRADRDSSLLY